MCRFDIVNLGIAMKNCKDIGAHANDVADAIALQEEVIRNNYIYSSMGYADSKVRNHLRCIEKFREVDTHWTIDSGKQSANQCYERLKKGIYTYCIKAGAENESDLDEVETAGSFMKIDAEPTEETIGELWDKIYQIYYQVLKRLMIHAEYIPDEIFKMVCETREEFLLDNATCYYNQFSLEHLYFLYGLTYEMEKYVATHGKVRQSRF